MSRGDEPIYLVASFALEGADLAAFDSYEDRVLPLLAEHGGELLFRVRRTDNEHELHVLRFASADHLESYRADPRRMALAPLLQKAAAASTIGIYRLLGEANR